MVHRKKITLQHLAEVLGLTAHTVSRALRGLPGMSEDTRRDVIRKAQELGYRTKALEQSLAADRIPLYPAQRRRFLFAHRHGFGRQLHIEHLLLQGLQERLGPFGHQAAACLLPEHGSPQALEAWAEQQQLIYADGLFLPPVLPEGAEQWLLALPLPRVLIGFPPPGMRIDSVVWDVAGAVHQSVQHLIRQGHRRIQYIGAVDGPRGYRYRWQAYQEALADGGLAAEPLLQPVALRELLREPDGTERFAALLDAAQPTALLCALGEELDSLYYALSRIGRRIPEDYSLVCLETAQDPFVPDLTRPLLPVLEAGERAADRMLWRIANPTLPHEHIRLQSGFHEGGTVLPAG